MMTLRSLLSAVLLVALATPLCADYQAVLVPVAAFTPVPGVNGSLWVTEVVARNRGASEVQFGWPEGCGDLLCPEAWETILPATTKKLLLSREGMLVMGSSKPIDVVFSLRVRDLSRQSETWGTNIPVIRSTDGSSGPIDLLGVPATGQFRTTIRIYDWSTLEPHQFRVRVYALEGDSLVQDRVVTTVDIDRRAVTQAALADIIPATGPSPVRVEITPLSPDSRFWAFASVTNNETQHVTIVTP